MSHNVEYGASNFFSTEFGDRTAVQTNFSVTVINKNS